MDNLTKYLAQVINILFLYNVIGTCYGVLCGIVLLSVKDLIILLLPSIGLIKWYGFIAFGVLAFNIKPLVKKKYVDPKIEMQLKYVREMIAEANFSNAEKKQIWRDTIKSISKDFSNNSHVSNNQDDISQNSSTV